jgi:hypothetical protein
VLNVSVFHDLDASATRDSGEPGVNVRRVFIDDNGNGALDAGERAVRPDSNGLASLGKFEPGTYTLVLLNDARLSHTTPATQTIAVAGTVHTALFGVRRIR